jgi:hypothetical protein
MKVSSLIEHLKYMEETYGNLEVEMAHLLQVGAVHLDIIHFEYEQFPDEDDKFIIYQK